MTKRKNGNYIHYPKKLVDKLDEFTYYTDPEALNTSNKYFIKEAGGLSLLLFSDGICAMYRKLHCFWVVDMLACILPQLMDTKYTAYIVKNTDNSFYTILKDKKGKIAYCQRHPFTSLKKNLKLCLTLKEKWSLSLPSEKKGEKLSVDFKKIKERLDKILRANQTRLVNNLLYEDSDLYEVMENYYPDFRPVPVDWYCNCCHEPANELDSRTGYCDSCFFLCMREKSVSQWWAIDEYWANIFSAQGLVVLRAYGSFWVGRTSWRGAIEKDSEFEFLATDEAYHG